MKPRWRLILTLVFGLLGLFGLVVLGAVCAIGNELHQIHPILSEVFYVLVLAMVLALVVWPAVRLLMKPSIPDLDALSRDTASLSHQEADRIARILATASPLVPGVPALREGLAAGRDMRPVLVEAVRQRLDGIEELVMERAAVVFTATAISQNGTLDGIVALLQNLWLVSAIVDHFGYRPGLSDLLRIYVWVFGSALLADGLEDVVDETDLAAFLPLGVLAPVGGALVGSLLQGLGNALVTIRIGYLTRAYLSRGMNVLGRDERRAVRRQAIQHIPQVMTRVGKVAPKIPSILQFVKP